ncbi:hypothetical protein O3M35_003657 [Rhynocoris fuscipes]|uniref:Uncharacterized protein n=1 Tax=Rhynocoris fuscipes TaxID=488301 RepID=A0AAW1CKV0_9HEMI
MKPETKHSTLPLSQSVPVAVDAAVNAVQYVYHVVNAVAEVVDMVADVDTAVQFVYHVANAVTVADTDADANTAVDALPSASHAAVPVKAAVADVDADVARHLITNKRTFSIH